MNENAKEAAFRLLQFKDRTEKELRDKLKKKKFNDEDINDVILFLNDCQMLNDERYATIYISNRIAEGKGENYIRQKLREKGVREAIIQLKMEELYDREAEANVCLKRALRFLELDQWVDVDQDGNLNLIDFNCASEIPEFSEKDYARVFRRLVNQGFAPGKIYGAINKIRRVM